MNTLTATFENDVSDLFIGNTTNSTDAYLDEPSFLNNNSQNSDTESISEDSRKIRKKRNTYQKISDEIRIELLEAVNKGETLKSAARRYNINYSSAKSILHTYRREGRITKKSAQERTIKKKNTSSEEVSSPAKNVKSSKKKNPKSLNDCDFLQDTLPYNERTVSMTTCASLTEDNSPVSSGVNYNENFSSLLKPEYKETSQESRKLSIEHPIDNFFASQTDSYYPEVGADYYGETYNQSANVYNNDGIDSFQQLMNAFQRKPSLNTDDFFNDSNIFLYPKGITPVNSQENKVFNFDNNDNTPFNSYLETQDLLKQALRKASMGYNGGYRKNSFDMF